MVHMGPSNYVKFTSANAVERRYYEQIYLFTLSLESNLAQFFGNGIVLYIHN